MKRLLLIATIVTAFAVQNALAQWEEINNGLEGSFIQQLVVDNNTIYAVANNDLYQFDNSNNEWQKFGCDSLMANNLIIRNDTFFVGSWKRGFWKSTDKGKSWDNLNNGLNNLQIKAMAMIGNIIVAGTYSGLYYTFDYGVNWNSVNSVTGDIYDICIDGNKIYYTSNNCLYYSLDTCKSWNWVKNANCSYDSKVIAKNDTLIVTNYHGLGISMDGGKEFKYNNTGIPPTNYANKLVIYGDSVYLLTGNQGLFVSSIKDMNWVPKNNGLLNKMINSIAISENIIYIGTEGGVYKSIDEGNNWERINHGFNSVSVYSISALDNTLFLGTFGNGIFTSNDNGDHWTVKNNGLTDLSIRAIINKNDKVIACSETGNLYNIDNLGENWNSQTKIPVTNILEDMIYCDGSYIAATDGNGIMKSTDDGVTWYEVNIHENSNDIYSVAKSHDKIIAGTNNGLYLSDDLGEHWSKAKVSEYQIYHVYAKDSLIIASAYEGIYFSTNDGISWIKRKLDTNEVTYGICYNQFVITGSSKNGVLISEDLGESWQPKNEGLKNLSIGEMFIFGDYIFAGTGGGMFRARISDLIAGVTDQAPAQGGISVYPNPAQSTVNIRVDSQAAVQTPIRVYDIRGEKVAEGAIEPGSDFAKINVGGLATGVYFMRVGKVVMNFVKD